MDLIVGYCNYIEISVLIIQTYVYLTLNILQ